MKIDAPWLKNPEIVKLADAFKTAGQEFRFVGGCVRDTLLEKHFSDIDAATPATPEQVMQLLAAADIRTIPTGIEYGTITAIIHHRPIQITTLRKDVSTDGRHAEVAYTDDWKKDADRRDFTMNALYLGMDGTLYDYHHGEEDAKNGHVRFIGDATTRIREDYLRILRFFRFSAHYGKGALDADALRACKNEVAGIEKLSGERIQTEMMKLLQAHPLAAIFDDMEEAGVLSHICLSARGITVLKTLERLPVASALSMPPLLKLAALLPDKNAITALAKRFKLSNSDYESLKRWHDYRHSIHPSMSLAEQKECVRLWGGENYGYAVLLAYANSIQEWKDYEPLLSQANWHPPVFPVTGNDLLALNIAEGKTLGDALKRLESAWVQSDYTLLKDALLRLV